MNETSDTRDLAGRRRDGHVLVITMDRAEKRNAVDRAMADALDDALNELDDDQDLWAGVLTGSADVFSAGSDLTAGGDYATARGGEYGIIRRRRRKPLVAAVEGAALGGGLEIVLACDLVVAASTARFGLPEVRIGVVPTCAGLFRAPRALPLNLAKQLILTGRPIEAGRAYEVGFVNVLTAPGEALGPVYGVTLLHIETLISEINPDLDARILAGFLLNAIAPPVLTRMRDALRIDTQSLQDAARALLRGVVSQTNAGMACGRRGLGPF